MPRIETFTIWRFVHVAFSLNDFNEINDVATGFTANHARVRCLRRNDKRFA